MFFNYLFLKHHSHLCYQPDSFSLPIIPYSAFSITIDLSTYGILNLKKKKTDLPKLESSYIGNKGAMCSHKEVPYMERASLLARAGNVSLSAIFLGPRTAAPGSVNCCSVHIYQLNGRMCFPVSMHSLSFIHSSIHSLNIHHALWYRRFVSYQGFYGR